MTFICTTRSTSQPRPTIRGAAGGVLEANEVNNDSIFCRRARRDDIPALRRMQERSIRVLGAGYYDVDDLDAFLRTYSTMNDAVVDEGHYFVLETPDRRIVASAGWSQQPAGFSHGGDVGGSFAATVRSVFVDADFGRLGLGRRVMETTERDAAAAGIVHLSVPATLSGVPFYTALGYREVVRRTIEMGSNAFELVLMDKPLASANENDAGSDRAGPPLRAIQGA